MTRAPCTPSLMQVSDMINCKKVCVQCVTLYWAAGRASNLLSGDQMLLQLFLHDTKISFEPIEPRMSIITVRLPLKWINRHTSSIFLLSKCIGITCTVIQIKETFERFMVIEGQCHWDPHQNYCWCDALARYKNVVSKTKEVEMNRSYTHINHLLDGRY